MISTTTIAYLLLLSSINNIIQNVSADRLGIPGTTQTDSGYDTEMGEDPMCWSSVASETPEGGIAFPLGYLVKDFALADEVKLLKTCPKGTWLEARSPPEFADPDFIPRTFQWYNYTVSGSIDLANLDGKHIASDSGSKIAIAMLACDSLLAGFCSPFIHEQANIRLAREKEAMMATGIPIPPQTAKAPGFSHGGTHVHSPAIILDIPNTPDHAGFFDFEVHVAMIINDPGQYFMVASLQFFTGVLPFAPYHRYDVANALKAAERLVVYEEPPTILKVTEPVQIISYVAIGLTSAILLGLIAQVCRHRNHQVLRISQSYFLVAFLLSGLVATISCVLLQPKSDLLCNLSHPLIVVPLHLFFSITLARLWRINAVVSPLLKNRLHRVNTCRASQGFLSRLWNGSLECVSRKRQVSSSAFSCAIIFISCLPQVVLQLIAWLLQPQSTTVEYNESQSVGRCVCSDGLNHGQSIRNYSIYFLLLLVLILLIMGHRVRSLPSLLNESTEIYDTTILSLLLAILGGGVIAVTNEPTTSPDVEYLVKVVLVLTITTNSSLKIIGPKLKMVWSDQKIVVSRLVADHRQSMVSETATNNDYTSRYDSPESIASISVSGNASNLRSPVSPATARGSEDNSFNGNTKSHNHDEQQTESSSLSPLDASNKSSQEVWLQDIDGTPASNDDDMSKQLSSEDQLSSARRNKISSASRRVPFATPAVDESPDDIKDDEEPTEDKLKAGSSSSVGLRKRRLVIRQGQAPSKKVVLRMIDLQRELDYVTKQVMCGLNVEPQDWKAVRDLTEKLNNVFKLVDFDFEQEDGDTDEENVSH